VLHALSTRVISMDLHTRYLVVAYY
jgi:hypothetical protein